MTGDMNEAANLYAAWLVARDWKDRKGSDDAIRAGQAAWDALIDYVEAHDLNHSVFDPR